MDGHHEHARQAAGEATDISRLLPGEDPATQYEDDARHWVVVYSELLKTKTKLLDSLLQEIERAGDPAVTDELDRDQAIMLSEIDRFNRRIQFWQQRERSLRRPPAGASD
jgi:hypothetical protein